MQVAGRVFLFAAAVFVAAELSGCAATCGAAQDLLTKACTITK